MVLPLRKKLRISNVENGDRVPHCHFMLLTRKAGSGRPGSLLTVTWGWVEEGRGLHIVTSPH
jgi:hypothetical protein